MKAQPAKRGPKPLHGENMQAFHFRMTQAQREKLDRLGGAAWIREQIEHATDVPRETMQNLHGISTG